MALLKLGKLDEALDAYKAALRGKTGAASLMGRAFVYLRKGDRAQAEADAAAARKMSARSTAVRRLWAQFRPALRAAKTKNRREHW